MKIVVPQKHTFAQVIGPKVSFQFYETIKRVRYLWCYKINTVFDWEFMQSKYGTKPSPEYKHIENEISICIQ